MLSSMISTAYTDFNPDFEKICMDFHPPYCGFGARAGGGAGAPSRPPRLGVPGISKICEEGAKPEIPPLMQVVTYLGEGRSTQCPEWPDQEDSGAKEYRGAQEFPPSSQSSDSIAPWPTEQ